MYHHIQAIKVASNPQEIQKEKDMNGRKVVTYIFCVMMTIPFIFSRIF